MIDTSISHYKIIDKLGEGGMSQNHPRVFFTSGCDFEDPAEAKRKREVSI
jgi:hypothetical protein